MVTGFGLLVFVAGFALALFIARSICDRGWRTMNPPQDRE